MKGPSSWLSTDEALDAFETGLRRLGRRGDVEPEAKRLRELARTHVRRQEHVPLHVILVPTLVGALIAFLWVSRYPVMRFPQDAVAPKNPSLSELFSLTWRYTDHSRAVGATLVGVFSWLLLLALLMVLLSRRRPLERPCASLVAALTTLHRTPADSLALARSFSAAEAAFIAMPSQARTQVGREHRRGWQAHAGLQIGALEVGLLDGSGNATLQRATLADALCRVLLDEWPSDLPEEGASTVGRRLAASSQLTPTRIVAALGAFTALLPLLEGLLKVLSVLAK